MIKIEVTGNSIGEVADKLLAIGGSLRSTAINALDNSARDALQAKRDAAKAEVAEEAPASPTPEEPALSGQTEAPAPPTEEKPSASAEPLNFELDVAPVVLRAVAAKGKPFVQDVLSEFGGARASDLDEALWPELIARLEAEIA